MNSSKKIKVAYIISIAHGVDAWTYREIETLSQGGNYVFLLPLRFNPGPYMPKADWDCYHFSWINVILSQPWCFVRSPIKYLSLLFEAIQTRSLVYFLLGYDFSYQMAKRNVDMIHCVFGDHKFFVGYYCKKILNLPLSVALYGYDLKANPNWLMLRKALAIADTIIVNCDFNKRLLDEIAGHEIAERSKTIYHFAKIPDGDDAQKVRILIVGGWVPRKGHDVLFKAIKVLGSAADNVEIWVAGYPGSIDMQQLARDLDVEKKVIVFGSIADQGLEFLYQNCDIFCLPSKTVGKGVNEGLPVALIEAMAYAKPVVASNLGGISELVEEILVEEGDVQGLAKALYQYISDPALRIKAGIKNREIVKTKYSRQNINQMHRLWEEKLKSLSKTSIEQ